jgi:hypothetical protein
MNSWWWLAGLLLVQAPQAPPRPDRYPPLGDCRDDNLLDRCSPEQQRRVRELFGVKTIEAHRDAGDRVRRAFYVDGYGRDVVAIAFVRAKGADPTLFVHFPRERDEKRIEPLRATVPQDVWDAVIDRSRHFDRWLQEDPPASVSTDPDTDAEITLCIHSWVYTVEAADPAHFEGAAPTLRRRTEDACDNGLAETYATELQRAALALLPHCVRLERDLHRNEATLLSACRLLRGDRFAAAEVMNRLDHLRRAEGPEDVGLLAGIFAHDARIDWAGEAFDTKGGAAAAWARKLAEGGRTVLYYDYVEGESANRVRFVGQLSRSVEGQDRYLQARVEQIWSREGRDFQIERATVGPFRPKPASDGKP